jgi:hypothetical protein
LQQPPTPVEETHPSLQPQFGTTTMGSGQPKVFKPFFNNSPVARLGVRPSPTKVFQTSARCCTLLEKVEEKEEGGWWFGGFGALWFGGRGLVGGCGLVTGLGGWGLVVVVWWLGFGASKRLTPNGYNMQHKHAPKHDNDKHTNCSTTFVTTHTATTHTHTHAQETTHTRTTHTRAQPIIDNGQSGNARRNIRRRNK